MNNYFNDYFIVEIHYLFHDSKTYFYFIRLPSKPYLNPEILGKYRKSMLDSPDKLS